MADKNIGALPQAAQLNDDSLLVVEQQGQAMKIKGAQFKEFGRQAVIGQVQGYVDQAEAAADRAADAVSAVTDMTVEARTLEQGQPAMVTKTTKDGKVNLAFGLPRGAQGVPGPEGQTGPRGPQGPTGKGLTILGYYDTLDALRAAVPNPGVGDPYGVGTEAPYNIYVFDGVTMDWRDNGQLSGGGGGPLPENVVTAEGGASMTFPLELGDGPHIITFTDEEEPPLTAEDVTYDDGTVKDALDGLKSSVSDGKALVASAITDKGVDTAQDATFAEIAENIGEISTGSDTSDATATSSDILAGKTAYTAHGKVEGVIPTLLGQTITPGTANQIIAGGQYLGGTQTIKGDPNLTSGNIKSGVSLFGVVGALESEFQAILTVKADTGAVVTATHTDGTKVEALSINGQVVFDLPKDGTWKVTAVRGVAQYNTVTIRVTSQYSAALTAEVHIEYFIEGTPLSQARGMLSAASNSKYALFLGGWGTSPSDVVDAYDVSLVRTSAPSLSEAKYNYTAAAAALGEYVIFPGDAYDSNLVRKSISKLENNRNDLAAAALGGHALFGGGKYYESSTSSSVLSSIVDVYSTDLTHTTAMNLIVPRRDLAASANSNYVLFGGGANDEGYGRNIVDAYNSYLTRSTPAALDESRYSLAAATAGNYILFAGGIPYNNGDTFNTVDAYDLFLTKTTVGSLNWPKYGLSATSLSGYAIFAGGRSIPTSGAYYTTVYDSYLVKTNPNHNISDMYLAATSIGDYALFGGGGSIGSGTDTVTIFRHV